MAEAPNPQPNAREESGVPTTPAPLTAPTTLSSPRSALEQAPCVHCGATGVCKNGPKETACFDCVARLSAKIWQRWTASKPNTSNVQKGCWCGVCLGKGRIEGATFKILKFFPFAFALLFIGCCFVVLWHTAHGELDKLQGALTTIMGTIVGFYFGGRRSDT
jgi:hypothetical protein